MFTSDDFYSGHPNDVPDISGRCEQARQLYADALSGLVERLRNHGADDDCDDYIPFTSEFIEYWVKGVQHHLTHILVVNWELGNWGEVINERPLIMFLHELNAIRIRVPLSLFYQIEKRNLPNEIIEIVPEDPGYTDLCELHHR